jgi:hypothetical protein
MLTIFFLGRWEPLDLGAWTRKFKGGCPLYSAYNPKRKKGKADQKRYVSKSMDGYIYNAHATHAFWPKLHPVFGPKQ